MPELPEVETARRIVERELTGRRVVGVALRLPKLFRNSEIADPKAMIGQTVIGARRRAKVLAIDFDGELTLLVHFKLAGQLAVVRPNGARSIAGHPVPKPYGEYPHKATHFDIRFDDGTVAWFSDIRQFGWYRLMPTLDVDVAIAAFGFGPEGTGEQSITDAQLAASISRRSIPIKQAILDQSVVAGVGNIYADEALFHARIHPEHRQIHSPDKRSGGFGNRSPGHWIWALLKVAPKSFTSAPIPPTDFRRFMGAKASRAWDAAGR